MKGSIVFVALAMVGVLAGTADADRWYYRRGDMTPGRGADIGPFTRHAGCVHARRADPTGEAGACENREQGEIPARLALYRLSVGMLAGPGWSDHRPGSTTTGAGTGGVELAMLVGREPFGLEISGGVWGADASSDIEENRAVFPIGIGVGAQPGGRRVRANLGAGAMMALATSCSDCKLGAGVRAHAGVDFWISPSLGFSVAAIAQFVKFGSYSDNTPVGPFGHSFEAPRFMLRVAMLMDRS
jgi:hypothetical protein